MTEYSVWDGVWVILFLAPLAFVTWGGLMYALFHALGINLKMALYEITLPESVFFGAYAIAAAYLVGAVFSRFA